MSTPRVVFLWSEAKGDQGVAGFRGFVVDVPPPLMEDVVLSCGALEGDSFCFCFFFVDFDCG